MAEIFPLTKPKRDIRIPETVSPAVIKTCLRATPLNMRSEVRSLRIGYRKSKWLRFLVDSFGLMGDRGYRSCEYVEVCESKEQKGIR
jgi:hypothetical protein